jgi:MFS superfamily sulfate permease-like transporter
VYTLSDQFESTRWVNFHLDLIPRSNNRSKPKQPINFMLARESRIVIVCEPSTRERSAASMAGWLLQRAAELRRDFTWREAGGSLGDLGTFVPLLVGLTVTCGLDVGTTLVFTGLYNLATALVFDVPMPLQPMKTIAAVAMTDPPMGVPQIVAAGGFVALVVLILGSTGLMERFNQVTPLGVVRGMQLGLGMLLCAKGWTLAVWTDGSKETMRGWWGPDGIALGAVALAFVLAAMTAPTRRVTLPNETPSTTTPESTRKGGSNAHVALVLVALGVLIAACRPGSLDALRIGPAVPSLGPWPSLDEWTSGITRAGLPQLPLTTLNSVVATCALSKDLFPDRPVRPTGVAVSVGAMNLIGLGLGVMPVCHGAGGLAAHYRFGARTGAATAFLGTCKLCLGVVFGGSLLTLLGKFPGPLLGVLLAAASAELIRAGLATDKDGVNDSSRDESVWYRGDADQYAMIVTAATTVASGSTGLGALFGFATHGLGLVGGRLGGGGTGESGGGGYVEVEMESSSSTRVVQ